MPSMLIPNYVAPPHRSEWRGMIRTYKRGQTYYVDCVSAKGRIRSSLGTSDKVVASRLRSRLEVCCVEGSRSAGWSELRKSLPASTYRKFTGPVEISWDGLVKTFWADCKRKQLTVSTLKRYQTAIDKFTEYIEGTELEDITSFVIQQFRDTLTAGVYQDMSCLRGVFGAGVTQGIIKRNPVEAETKPEIIRGTKPYTADELNRIREACGPEDLLMLLVFRWTGMRGSDVADLQATDIQDDEIRRKAIKNGVNLEIPLQAELKNALKGCPLTGNVITYENKFVNRAFLSRRMRLIYNKADILDGHNHRFRATFAVDLLLKGATVFEVAKALGDETRTVEKHYLKFVPHVRERLKGFLDDQTKGIEVQSK